MKDQQVKYCGPTLYFPKSRCMLYCCWLGYATDGKLAEAYILSCK